MHDKTIVCLFNYCLIRDSAGCHQPYDMIARSHPRDALHSGKIDGLVERRKSTKVRIKSSPKESCSVESTDAPVVDVVFVRAAGP